MKLILWSILVFSPAAIVVAAPAPARAEDAREVEGRAAFSKGDYARALDIFARLYAEDGDPVYLRNIGRCHQKLRQPDEAIEAFRNYLRRGKKLKPAEKKEVEGFIAEMQALKTTMKEAAAADRGSAERAEKDRAKAAEAPPPADGKARTAPAPAATEPIAPKVAPEPGPRIARIPGSKVEPPKDGSGTTPEPASAKDGSWHASAAWVGLGLTLLASGVGVYGVLHNHSLVADFNRSCAVDLKNTPYSTSSLSDSACVGLHDDYQAATRLAIGSFVGAAVLAGATVVVWLTAPSSSESQVSMGWSCAPGMTPGGGAAIGCRLRF